MHSTLGKSAIATTTDSCNQLVIYTPQRKARYSDKARVRRADIKRAALEYCNCRDSSEMKQRLRHLGIKLDLRLTSAWIAIAWELKPLIENLVILGEANKIVPLSDKKESADMKAVVKEPSILSLKIIPPIHDRRPTANLSDQEAMTYYLDKYGWG